MKFRVSKIRGAKIFKHFLSTDWLRKLFWQTTSYFPSNEHARSCWNSLAWYALSQRDRRRKTLSS
jgi:hypothetical protein